MLKMKQLVFFGLSMSILIGLSACRTTEEISDNSSSNESIAEQTSLPMRMLVDGYLTGNGEEGIDEGGTVINSRNEWEELMLQMNAVNQVIDDQTIDFNRTTVIAYFDQIRGSGGYSVNITSVVKDGNKLVASIRKTAPSEDAIEIMTQPFVIVSLEKTDLPVTFVD